jgi:(p)ppGpp synthase/HD superfamily hydrolase
MRSRTEANYFDVLKSVIDLSCRGHSYHPRQPGKAFRKWDGRTPYFAHPVWCATMILHEPRLPEALRRRGAQALALHDLLEDTTLELPDTLSPAVRRLVRQMTFEGGSAQEHDELWTRPPEVRLLKLYDKVCNLLDDGFMPEEKRRKSRRHVRRLLADVEAHYPGTNIARFARALLKV